APLLVGARYVAAQRSELPLGRIKGKRDVVGYQPARTRVDQHSERPGADEVVLNLETVFAEVRRLVHAESLRQSCRRQVANRWPVGIFMIGVGRLVRLRCRYGAKRSRGMPKWRRP